MKAGPSAQPVIRPKRKSRQVWVRETNASEPLMSHRNRSTGGIETGVPPLSDSSLGPGAGLETCSEKGASGAPRGRKY